MQCRTHQDAPFCINFPDWLDQHATELDRLDALDMGKPISIEFANAAASAGLIRYCADAVENIISAAYSSDKSCFIAQQRVPRGVSSRSSPLELPDDERRIENSAGTGCG